MRFGHIENSVLIYAKLPVTVSGREYFTDDAAIMLKAGEKEIIDTAKPDDKNDGIYVSSWNETETQIKRIWTFKPYTEEEKKLKYRALSVKYIREKYSINDENQILREYLAYGDQYKQAFDEYNAYVEECRSRAHIEIYGE